MKTTFISVRVLDQVLCVGEALGSSTICTLRVWEALGCLTIHIWCVWEAPGGSMSNDVSVPGGSAKEDSSREGTCLGGSGKALGNVNFHV